MTNRRSGWITKAAAVAALVGGLGGAAHASILVAGGFPGEDFYNAGAAQCVITNLGTRDVVVNVSMYDGSAGALLEQQNGWIVHPGQTRTTVSVAFANNSLPSGCTFDVSTRTGVRAAFAYENGAAVTVVPATK